MTSRNLVYFILFFLLAGSFGYAGETGDAEWKKIRERKGIKVYRKPTDDSKIKSFKVVTTVPVKDLTAFLGLMRNHDNYPDWMHMVSTVEFLGSDGPLHGRYNLKTLFPPPVKHRQVNIDVTVHQEEDYSLVFDFRQAESRPEEKRGYVIVPEMYGFTRIQAIPDSEMVELTWELFADPGGVIPTMMVNLLSDDMAYFTVKKMIREIQSGKYDGLETGLIKRRPWISAQ